MARVVRRELWGVGRGIGRVVGRGTGRVVEHGTGCVDVRRNVWWDVGRALCDGTCGGRYNGLCSGYMGRNETPEGTLDVW